jgi:hypothetical protein
VKSALRPVPGPTAAVSSPALYAVFNMSVMQQLQGLRTAAGAGGILYSGHVVLPADWQSRVKRVPQEGQTGISYGVRCAMGHASDFRRCQA